MVTASLQRLRSLDPDLQRFGAAAHGYRLSPPVPGARVAEIEAESGVELPPEYRAFITELGASGAGPGYGLVPLDHRVQLEALARAFPHAEALRPPPEAASDYAHAYWGATQQDGTILLADHGCTYLSLLVVNGPDSMRGRVVADLRSAGIGIIPTHATFTAWYQDWLAAASHEPSLVTCPAPGSRCALPATLQSYLDQVAKQREIASERLSMQEAATGLSQIAQGGITLATGADRFFEDGAPRLCSCCRGLLQRFIARGIMREEQLAPAAQRNKVEG